jgi:tetratricopeptide (TPR) repeat protein
VGERKQVTVLFADIKDSTELIRGLDPEAAQQLLDPAIHRMMAAVHRFEGTVNQVLGDGIMALFGAPIAHEDHALRACYAALAMQAAMQAYTEEARRTRGLELRMRVGLHAGEVVVRAIGNDLHMDYSAVGETTHLAARMEQLATPGSTRLTAATLLGDDSSLIPLKQLLITRTAGNPFFLEESVRSLVEAGMLVGTPGAYRLVQALPTIQVPATVQAVLAARIDRLPLEAKRLLQTAAVIGTEVPFALLQAVVDCSEQVLHHSLAQLQGAEFLYETHLFPEREYTFKHALTHEVAYSSLLQERRRVLHGQIVAALERLSAERLAEQVDRLAHHAVRGAVWDKALLYCRQAGARAVARSAHHEAVACFEQALTALAQLPEDRNTLEQAIDVRCDLHNALLPLDEHAQIFAHLHAAEAIAERLHDTQRLGRIAGYLCVYFSAMDEHDHAITAGQRALALATAGGAFDGQVVAQSHLGWAYHAIGDFRQALDLSRQAMALLTGELLSARFGRVAPPAITFRGVVTWCLGELGDFAEGRGVGEEGVRLAEAAEQPYPIIGMLSCIGSLYRRQGALHMAIPRLERGLILGQTTNIPRFFPLTVSALGAAYALAGRAAEALPLLDQMLERLAPGSRMFQHANVLIELSEALLLVGRVNEAHALAERLRELSSTHTGHGYQAHAYRLLGDVAMHREPLDIAQAEARYRQALALAEAMGMRPLQAHCHHGLGTLYARMGRPEPARSALSAAIDLYRAMDMTFWLSQAEAALAQVERR